MLLLLLKLISDAILIYYVVVKTFLMMAETTHHGTAPPLSLAHHASSLFRPAPRPFIFLSSFGELLRLLFWPGVTAVLYPALCVCVCVFRTGQLFFFFEVELSVLVSFAAPQGSEVCVCVWGADGCLACLDIMFHTIGN